MRVFTLSGRLETEGEGQTLKGVGRLESRIEKQIVDRETHKWEVGWRNAQIQLLLNGQTDLLTDTRILRIDPLIYYSFLFSKIHFLYVSSI